MPDRVYKADIKHFCDWRKDGYTDEEVTDAITAKYTKTKNWELAEYGITVYVAAVQRVCTDYKIK